MYGETDVQHQDTLGWRAAGLSSAAQPALLAMDYQKPGYD